MRRTFRSLRETARRVPASLRSASIPSENGRPRHASDGGSALRIWSRTQPRVNESVEDMLSSALLAQDKQLAGLIREVDEALKNLKSESPASHAVTDALHRTVLCAVKESLMESELRSLAMTDDLTCLYNRRAFLALAAQQVKLMLRNDKGLLLFFADVDDLKQINDSFGHREGDIALVRVADALEHTFRDSDIIARLGGDEFAVVALETSGENQAILLRRLEENLRKFNAEESRYQLTLSVGVSRLDPQTYVSVGELLEQADRAMYREKKRKRHIREFAVLATT